MSFEDVMNYAYGMHPIDWVLLASFLAAVWALNRWFRRMDGGINR